MSTSSEWGILLCVVIATHGLLALENLPQTTLVATLTLDNVKPRTTNDNYKLEEVRDEMTSAHEGPTSKETPQTKSIERRNDHYEVTHGVGYSTHLDPQYYQGNHMGKYYDCALQGPWKPIQGHYVYRGSAASGGSAQSSQRPHLVHHQPVVNHHHEHSGTSHNSGNAFGTNYLEEWDQKLKEILQGPSHGNPESGGHRNVVTDGGHHHSGGQEVGQNSGGYKVTSTVYGGSGADSPYNGWEDHSEGHHSPDIVQGHQEGGKGSASFQTDFPYQFDNDKWHEWTHEEPNDGSSSNDEAHEGYPQDSGQGEEYSGLKEFREAVKNIGDIRYTHAIFGLIGDNDGRDGEEQREGAASQGYQNSVADGGEEGEAYHHGSSGAEESSGGQFQGHAAPPGNAGGYGTVEGYAVGGGHNEEGGEQSNPTSDYAGGGAVKGAETGGDFNAPHAEPLQQPPPVHQASHTGTGYGGGQGSQAVTRPYSEGVQGDQHLRGHYAHNPVNQYETPPPRCPYVHDHLHHQAAPVTNAIQSLPYDEGTHTNHLQFMMPPKLQSHANLIPVQPLKEYEVYEKQEETENKETVAGRPNYIPAGQHAYHGGERPLSDDASIQQQVHAEAFAGPNKVVDGSSLPSKQEEGDDFLRPPPLLVTDHYIKANGNFKGFSDGRRKRRPFARPGSHSGAPHIALYKRPAPFMMRARPVIRGPIKRLPFA